MGVRNHRVGGDYNAALSGKLCAKVRHETPAHLTNERYLLLLIGGEHSDLLVRHVGPLEELLPPLHHRYPTRDAVCKVMMAVVRVQWLTRMCIGPSRTF